MQIFGEFKISSKKIQQAESRLREGHYEIPVDKFSLIKLSLMFSLKH